MSYCKISGNEPASNVQEQNGCTTRIINDSVCNKINEFGAIQDIRRIQTNVLTM